jgi:NAD(P)-dependent dehydrogenase (short-subunit alcohol dehydrogenase family)
VRLKDKTCIITGASGGMGRVAVGMFCAEGAHVVAADVDESAGREAVRLAVQTGPGTAIFVKADVAAEDDSRLLIDEAVRTFGRLDVLYNNAGIMPESDHSVVDTPTEVWERVQRINVGSYVLCAKYAVPAMIASGGGSVINIASFVALMGCTVPQDAYTASKGAIISLTRSMAIQFGPSGVRTNAICPGPIETPLMTEWLVSEPEALQLRLNRIPLGRLGKPEEVVHLAVYLASDESNWTNGASIVVDGGISVNYF